MNIVILDIKNIGLDLDFSSIQDLGNSTVYENTSPEQIIERSIDADCLVFNKIKLYEDMLCRLPKLKLICVTATGYDNVDIDYCKKHGIAVCNVKGYSTQSVSQITVSLALSLFSKHPEFDEYVKSSKYSNGTVANYLEPVFNEIDKKIWGIVGYGNIGAQVAKVANALGCKVLAFSKSQKEGVENVELDELLKRSDIVSLHVPYSSATENLISREKLAIMKKSAILINVARGAVTDEKAIADALLSGNLGGFATDVYTIEPFPVHHPFTSLFGMKNVIFTPHMAWAGYESRERVVKEVAQNITSYLQGQERNRIC